MANKLCKASLPVSSATNHASAIEFQDHVQHFIDTELTYHALAGPFETNPLLQNLVCSPLQKVPKRNSSKRRVVMDLSYPLGQSVNSGIPKCHYLNDPFQLRLPGIDRLCELIRSKGRGCLIYEIDLWRAYRQFPVDPIDYSFLGFTFLGKLYFDLRCPFGLRSSSMICQRTTKGVIYILTNEGFFADVYLDDFFGAEKPEFAETAFHRLQALLGKLGLETSAGKDLQPSTDMLCLGIQVNTIDFTLRVPEFRITELLEDLNSWLHKLRFTKKQLQALLGKLSFVTACIKPGRIFLAFIPLRGIYHSTRQYAAVTSKTRAVVRILTAF